jgi:glutathione synthase/RimK-type ligase-like ATP-grasp enzyme
VTVALATCAEMPEGDDDERLLPPALAARGIDARFAVWDDPAEDWGAFDLVVVRSTWDYTVKRDAYLDWAGSVPRLLNTAAVLRWNTDKRYIDDLAAAGLEVVPTAFVVPGGPRPPLHGEVVVKPAVSGGAMDTARFATDRHRQAHEHLTTLQSEGRVAMLQPYLGSVDDRGETALIHLGDEFSHAIRKGAILRPGAAPLGAGDLEMGMFAAENITPREPTPAERELGDAVVAYVRERFGPPLYARIDVVEDDAGEPRVLELELTEPSLFLASADGAAGRFAAAIEVALRRD